MTADDLHWLAGLLEGEGSFLKGPPSSPGCPAITVTMCDEDIIARVAQLFGNGYMKCARRADHHRVPYRAVLSGGRAVELMIRLRPLMGLRRQTQIDCAVATGKLPQPAIDVERVLDLRTMGFSYREIAKRVGCSHQHVSKLVRCASGDAARLSTA